MRRYILNQPATEPLSLPEVKRFLRIDHADDDALVQGLVKAARQRVEARTGRALISQTWRIVLDAWPYSGRVALPILPISSVMAVRLLDGLGGSQTVAPPVYNLVAGAEPPVIDCSQIPNPGKPRDGIEIDVTAGYGAAATDVPEPLRQAMRLMVGHAYTAAGPDGRGPAGREPADIDALIAPYRLGRIGAAIRLVSA
ncbi:MAG: head-tail connector protein [Beijerinckiaceae bacterium]